MQFYRIMHEVHTSYQWLIIIWPHLIKHILSEIKKKKKQFLSFYIWQFCIGVMLMKFNRIMHYAWRLRTASNRLKYGKFELNFCSCLIGIAFFPQFFIVSFIFQWFIITCLKTRFCKGTRWPSSLRSYYCNH